MTSWDPMPGIWQSCGRVYLVRVEPTELPERKTGELAPATLGAWEPVVPDTDQAYTVQEMARAWQAIGKPVPEDDAALSVDPDDYPLF
jgi:hypothetical protein